LSAKASRGVRGNTLAKVKWVGDERAIYIEGVGFVYADIRLGWNHLKQEACTQYDGHEP
jgi:hypothetical protein